MLLPSRRQQIFLGRANFKFDARSWRSPEVQNPPKSTCTNSRSTIMAWRAPSNGRLPFDDGSVWLQTLGKRVSDEQRKKRKTSKTIRKKTQAKIVES